jgi:signal peptidase I
MAMTDLRSRLRDLDRVESPELWPEILVREPAPLPESPSRARLVVALAVAVAILAAGVLVPLTLLRLGPLARPGGSGHRTMTITYPSEAMEPTVHVGQILVIDLDAYRSSPPQHGDIVAFRFRGQLVVKRVIGLPGEVVEEQRGKVFVNGDRLEEPYILPDTTSVSLGPWTVPAEHVFVMGDNRPNSNDSRYGMGPIALQDLVGKVLLDVRATSAPPPPSAPAVTIEGLLLATEGPVRRLVEGVGALYAVYQPNPSTGRDVLVRRDSQTGALVRTAALASVRDIELAGGWLWVSGQQQAGSPALFRLDPRTLEVRGRAALPGAGALAASGPAGLWVGVGDRLDLIDPANGRIIVSLKADGQVGALAVDPLGRFLYVATNVPGEVTPRSITERDASTGVVRATLRGFAALAVRELSATSDGVWVSFPTGLLGQVAFLRASDLRQVASFTPRPGEGGTNGIHANVAAGVLWVADDMVGQLWCADPVTGAVRAPVALPAGAAEAYGLTDVVSVGSELYAGTQQGVLRVNPDRRCAIAP